MTLITLDPRSRQAVFSIQNMRVLTQRAVELANFASANQLLRATSREILRRPKGGRTYIRRDRAGRRRRHVASAPGETHANMTGRLRRSLSFRIRGQDIEFGYGVRGNNAPPYARAIEFGSRRIEPRPSLSNGIQAEQRNMITNLQREIDRALH